MNDFSTKLKKEIETIHVPEDKLNFAIENAIKKGSSKRKKLAINILYGISAAVLLFGLLISSAFISPTMAEVVSKIPYLNQLFKSKPLDTIIWDKLNEKGYKIGSTGISYSPKKTVQVSVEGSEEYYNEVNDEIKKIVKEILESKGYNTYSIKVMKQDEFKEDVLSKEEQKEKTLLENEVTKKLKELNYTFDMVQADPTEKAIFINIVGSKTYYEKVNSDIEKVAEKIADLNQYEGYTIKVTRVSVEIRRADKGSEVIPVIAEGLMSKKEYKVIGVGYKSKPFKIIVTTSVKSKNPTAEKLGMKIETEIKEFLQSKEGASILGDEPYEIIVYSKDKKKLNN